MVADEQADLEVEVVYNSDIKLDFYIYVYPGLATDYFLRSHPQRLIQNRNVRTPETSIATIAGEE